MSPDGTNCAAPTEQTLNSGPKKWAFSCADSNSSVFYGSVNLPDSWDAGTVTFKLRLFHGTTETITFAGDFSAQCHSGGTVSSTYGSAVAADVSITTANKYVTATTSAVTPDATGETSTVCHAGDELDWKYVVDATNFSTNAANAKVIDVTMEYSVSTRSD
jgi:hypothetical protein